MHQNRDCRPHMVMSAVCRPVSCEPGVTRGRQRSEIICSGLLLMSLESPCIAPAHQQTPLTLLGFSSSIHWPVLIVVHAFLFGPLSCEKPKATSDPTNRVTVILLSQLLAKTVSPRSQIVPSNRSQKYPPPTLFNSS